MEDLLDQWTAFVLTPEEENQLTASAEVVEKGQRLVPIGLVGKLVTSKLVSKTAFIDTISQLWRVKGLKIKALPNNHFQFTFPNSGEIDRILGMEPWNFNRSLLLLTRFEGFYMGEVGSFPFTHLWVRAFNIPPAGMISDIGIIIGNDIGEFISVDADDMGCCEGTFMRIRVKYDISRPLRRVLKLSLGPKYPSIGVLLRYERLPEFCYICGILGHINKDCSKKDHVLDIKAMKYPYGTWLRAEDDKISLPPVNVLINLPKSSLQTRSVTTDVASSSAQLVPLEGSIDGAERPPVDLIGHKRGPLLRDFLPQVHGVKF